MTRPCNTPAPQRRHLAALTSLCLALSGAALLGACGGGGDPAAAGGTAAAAQVTLSGTAATGAAIANAEVTATNAQGAQTKVRTGADGSFSLAIADGAPYVLSVVDALGQAWYSYAAQAGVANITPLTTLALLDANANKPLADLARSWASAQLSASAVLASAAKVNAHLQSQFQAKGLNAASHNIFSTPFAANHTGFDAVLDALRVSFNCSATACSQSISSPQGGVLVSWNANIATTGISLSWTTSAAGGGAGSGGSTTLGLGSCAAPKAGTYSMLVQTTVSGLAGVAIPEVCIDGLPGKPSGDADFCGGATVTAQLPPGVTVKSCSFSGNSGTITAQISTPVVLDYSVKYTFVLN